MRKTEHARLSSTVARLNTLRAPPKKDSVGIANMCQRVFQTVVPPNRRSAARNSADAMAALGAMAAAKPKASNVVALRR